MQLWNPKYQRGDWVVKKTLNITPKYIHGVVLGYWTNNSYLILLTTEPVETIAFTEKDLLPCIPTEQDIEVWLTYQLEQ